MAALSYMQRRVSGTYEFRKRLPESLAGKEAPAHMREPFGDLINAKTGCFKRELVRSLQTKDFKQAKRRDHQEALRATQLFEHAVRALAGEPRSDVLTDADLQEIADEVHVELLTADAMEREDGDDRRRLQDAKERALWPDLGEAIPPVPGLPMAVAHGPNAKGMAKDHFHAYGHALAMFEDEYREAFARRDPTIVFAETSIALKRRGVPLDRTAPWFRAVAMKVLEAHVRAYDTMSERQRGKIVPTPKHVKDRGPKLSEAFERWCAGGGAKGAKRPNSNTIVEAEQVIRYFKELHGDLRLGDITREIARKFRDEVARVPRSLPRSLRRLPLKELLARDLSPYQPRSATTVNKMLTLIGAIISQAERDGHLDKVAGFANPFGKGIRFLIQEREAERTFFSRDDLRAIFGSPVFADRVRPVGGGCEAAFWFPLIGFLSGMRLDEIAQLRIRDLAQDEETGRWYFDVGKSGGRSTKTVSSIRHVPVHRELERIGLLRYRKGLVSGSADEDQSLWPNVKAQGKRPRSAAWSKWFGRYLREKCGVSDSAKVFHSFRHTFKRMTRDAGLPEEVHDALTGHTSNGGVGRGYGKGMSVNPLADALDRVEAPIDLSALRWLE
ncbi:site-specific integrase [Pseudolabrys sp. FHR47]|uniref:site-specific integrase n=1 Tax=Pseudolabrys sp. FHR47 TaxID=2562284 RepID=UPI0010BF0978|nr:site-specific integrase [Pseudolabrys sp. FHR47]